MSSTALLLQYVYRKRLFQNHHAGYPSTRSALPSDVHTSVHHSSVLSSTKCSHFPMHQTFLRKQYMQMNIWLSPLNGVSPWPIISTLCVLSKKVRGLGEKYLLFCTQLENYHVKMFYRCSKMSQKMNLWLWWISSAAWSQWVQYRVDNSWWRLSLSRQN